MRSKYLILIKYCCFGIISTTIILFSRYCMACEDVPEPSCEDSLHIISDSIKEMDEIRGLLREISTHLNTAVTTRKQLQNRLIIEVEKLEAKLEQTKSEQAKNQSSLKELCLMVENCIQNKHLPSEYKKNNKGLVIKEALKQKLEQAKEAATQAILLLLNHEDLGSPTTTLEDIQV